MGKHDKFIEKKATSAADADTAGRRPLGRLFPIAGIGASAGGLEALEVFLRRLPEKTGIAFVIVQHLDPSHKGMMPELLQRVTPMKVLQVRDRMRVKPDTVYVIPPNKDISILHGVLHLLEPAAPRGLRLPVDFFFRSLAEDRREQSIGLIFSGMGSDGTLGIRSIKEKGGLVAVQDPATAKFASMPRHALDTGLVDLAASVEELPRRIVDFIRSFPRNLAGSPALEAAAQNMMEKIVILLREKTGHDFSVYKKNTMYRRVERRMSLHQIPRIAEYATYLQKNPHELDLLFKELLIGVTSFFRDPSTWEILKREILPQMIRESRYGTTLRAWVPGCSTGEEAFSLAMVFQEAVDLLSTDNRVSLQIFATDLDAMAVEKARLGIFSPNIAADVSPQRLKRFFVREEEGYRINKNIREMVIFATQNVVMDPPFTKLDVISCRNLLIYLKPDTQKKLIPLFHYSLNPDGVLFLGNAETIGAFTDLFTAIEGQGRIYRRLPAPLLIRAGEFPVAFATARSEMTKDVRSASPTPSNLQSLAEQFILQRFSPASILANDRGDIFFISGRTGKYLEPAAGKANWNIFVMAREGLLAHLTGVFQKAVREQGSASLRDVEVRHEGGVQTVDVTVQYIHEPVELQGMVMIIIAEVPAAVTRRRKRGKSVSGMTSVELEAELQHTRKELQLTHEEMQTSLEELKATNEELQSTNEELQSTNEELTTSKEELQSLNEELQTVNAEQTAKVDELSRANNDMKNLLNSTEVATIFLDSDLQVRRFTSGSTKIFKLRPADIGRPLSEIVSDLVYQDISGDAADVLQTLMFSEKEIATRDGRWFRVRIMPYRTAEDRIDGVVITLVDMTVAKLLEEQLRSAESELVSLVKSAPVAIMTLSRDGAIVEFNHEAEKVHGRTKEQAAGHNYFELFVPEPQRQQASEEMLKALSGEPLRGVETVVAAGETERVLRWRVNAKRDRQGAITGIVAIAMDSIAAFNA
jgi:two-component system CheB/CheR fusion protein